MTTGAKMRVYEIAKELNIPNKELIAKIRTLGLEVNNHMSSLDAEDVNRLKRQIEKERAAKTETKRLSSTVIRRRSKDEVTGGGRQVVAADEPPPPPKPAAKREAMQPPVRSQGAEPPVTRRPAKSPSPQVTQPPKAAPAQPAAPTQSQSTPSAQRATAPAQSSPAPALAQPPAIQYSPVTPPAEPAAAQARPTRVTEEAVPTARPLAASAQPSLAAQPTPPPAQRAPVSVQPTSGHVATRSAAVELGQEAARERAPSDEPTPASSAGVTQANTAHKSAFEQDDAPVAVPANAASRNVEAPVVSAQAEASQKESVPELIAAPKQEERKVAAQQAEEPKVKSGEPVPVQAVTPPQQAKKPKTPVVIQGPPVVSFGSPEREQLVREPDAAQAPREDKRRKPAEGSVVKRSRPGQRDRHERGPQTVQDVTSNARNRFEEELERARKRVREREEDERKKRETEDAKQRESRPGRPAPGTVIPLPIPRIEIRERTPTTARPTNGRPGAAPAGAGQLRDRFAQRTRTTPGQRKPRDFNRKRAPGKKPKSTQITTPAEHKRIIRMEETIAIAELAKSMGVKANEVLKKAWSMGMVGININASIDSETAQILASEFGYDVQNVAFRENEVFTTRPDEAEDLEMRAPVVTVMGHVDHGKTSLLDNIRKSRVAAGEAGGITQHIAAYKVSAGEDSGDVVFLDTPGHEAFTEMRARGAQATDIVVLVVAANDGVMPQTVEAVNHAKDAKVPMIVAVNKCDLPDAQPERVRQQLADHGLIPEEWGGDTLYVDVSALRGDGIPELLEAISLTAEILELRANPTKSARGVVIEAKLDRARGPMATVLIQEGTLRTGDIVVAGRYFGKVRAMLDDLGNPVKEAGPSTPVELLGLDGVPGAGEALNVADDEKTAKQVVEHRRQQRRKKELASTGKISLENLMERIQEGETHELKIVLKTDVQGSAEALKASLVKQSTEKVRVNVISAGVGGITETDVNLAKAGGAIIVGFHVRPAGKSAKLAEKEEVQIKLYDVIYEALDDVRLAMAGLLAPIKREKETGKLEVRETFNIPRMGTVAGCMVTEGVVQRRSLLRVIRDAIQIYEGKVGSLRRFKEDTSEVKEGYECGLMIQGFNDIQVGDIVEAYEIVEEAAKL